MLDESKMLASLLRSMTAELLHRGETAPCHNRTRAVQQTASTHGLATSLDHLVGECEQRRRHFEAECLRGLKIDGEKHLARELYWQLARRRAVQDFIDKIGAATKAPAQIDAVAD